MLTMTEDVRKRADYIGDGAYVYADNDGVHLWVFTTDGISIQNQVALDLYVSRALLRILKERCDA